MSLLPDFVEVKTSLEQVAKLLGISTAELIIRIQSGTDPFCEDAVFENGTYVFRTRLDRNELRDMKYISMFLNRDESEILQLVKEGKLKIWQQEDGSLKTTSNELRKCAQDHGAIKPILTQTSKKGR
jgi:hypothetical protein